MLELTYATAGNGKLRLTVNGQDCSFVNAPSTGGWNTYAGRAAITLTLKPGRENTVRLTGGFGGVNLKALAVTPLDEPHEQR